MNKLRLLSGSILVLALSLVIWSCKDDFTEQDLLAQQARQDSLLAVTNKNLNTNKDSIALSILVYNGTISSRSAGGRTSGTQGLTGVAVALSADGKIKTGTTSADGLVNFYTQPGTVSGTLKATGFTTVNFTINITELVTSVTGGQLTNASVVLPVFETTGTRVAKVTGTLTAELNLLNLTRENAPDGVAISFFPDFSGASFLDAGSVNADIDKFSVEGAFVATVTSGAYTIDLPTAIDGLNYNYSVSDFTADQQLAINNNENDVANNVRAAVTIPTVFTFNSGVTALVASNFTTIPSVNSVQLDIEVPPASFTTAATATVPVLAPLAVAGGAGSFTVLAFGSGYTASSISIAVTVTPVGGTPTTVAILYAVSNASGQITGILANGVDPDGAGPLPASDYGAGYRGRSTLSIGGGGTGAIVIANYASTLQGITSSGGAGYVLAPTLSVRGLDVNGNSVEDTGATTISGGAVVGFTSPGQSFSSITSMSFRPVVRSAATFNPANFTVNSLGQVTVAGTGLSTFGTGYNPNVPPLVTVRSIRAGGSGASIIAEMSTTAGQVANLLINDGGSGYFNGNANFPTSLVSFSVVTANGTIASAGSPAIITALRPGLTRTLNLYGGTGTRTRGVQ